MADVDLLPGQVYEMGMLGGAPVVLNASDHVHERYIIRNHVQITGSLSCSKHIAGLRAILGSARYS